jgi:hypothetical protein
VTTDVPPQEREHEAGDQEVYMKEDGGFKHIRIPLLKSPFSQGL